ncbi:hypothetical protein [Streptomyces sp. P17]|uniref:hypothetical protein n=1 Tax=Streptomyces sp. P17 TaxID=3074716 RepID=UPI0028F455BD|nr:hypothetical protein [Streptomyces sp. P17]MDT9695231.1 hypothetical protein [Streptomyces sp. P17]
MAAVPERVRQAVALLDVCPADRLLEIGCGGVAVQLVCPLLKTGTITAVDRSATAAGRAVRRNAEPVREGRAGIARASFTAPELRPPAATGALYAFYEPPGQRLEDVPNGGGHRVSI